jgi:hypothetical protein
MRDDDEKAGVFTRGGGDKNSRKTKKTNIPDSITKKKKN